VKIRLKVFRQVLDRISPDTVHDPGLDRIVGDFDRPPLPQYLFLLDCGDSDSGDAWRQ
jgi:hypothetical protein